MPCTSHQHTSHCISNGWKSPSVPNSPTVNVMKWYQVCTCNVHVMYYSTTYVLSTELGSLGLKSHALADSWPTAPSATVSPWMWKGLKIMQFVLFFTQKSEKNWKVLETKQVNFGEQVDKWRQVDLRSWCHKMGLLSARTPNVNRVGKSGKTTKSSHIYQVFWIGGEKGPCMVLASRSLHHALADSDNTLKYFLKMPKVSFSTSSQMGVLLHIWAQSPAWPGSRLRWSTPNSGQCPTSRPHLLIDGPRFSL